MGAFFIIIALLIVAGLIQYRLNQQVGKKDGNSSQKHLPLL